MSDYFNYLDYFDFVPFELVDIIISYLDNDSLENFNLISYNKIDWNYISYLHTGKFNTIRLTYKEYYDYLSEEKLRSIFEIKGNLDDVTSLSRNDVRKEIIG